MAKSSPSFEQFFWDRVKKSDHGCWIWRGRITGRGYGTIKIGEFGKEILAHRASYQINKGPIPANMVVCHTCDVPACVNPDHLFVGTQKQNIADAISKNRWPQRGKFLPDRKKITHCPHGHPYDDANTGITTLKTGSSHRYCRACHRIRAVEKRRSERCSASI